VNKDEKTRETLSFFWWVAICKRKFGAEKTIAEEFNWVFSCLEVINSFWASSIIMSYIDLDL